MGPGDIAIRVIMAIVGFTGTTLNSITLYLLIRINFGSRLTTLLLRTQCIADGYSCFVILISRIAGSSITIGVEGLEIFLCHFWYEDAAFWYGCVMSVQNVVAIAFDRLYAVVSPVKYKKYQTALIIGCYTYICFLVLAMAGPTLLQRRYVNGTCLTTNINNSPALRQYFQIDSYIWTVFGYLLPALFFIISHGYIIYKLQHNYLSNIGSQGGKPMINFKVQKLVRTTAIMAANLLIFHLYETVTYVLDTAGIIPYFIGSVERQVGILLLVIASNVNPVVLIGTLNAVKKAATLYLNCFGDKTRTTYEDDCSAVVSHVSLKSEPSKH